MALATDPAIIEAVSSSWHRCLSEHGIDPGSREPPCILTETEMKDVRGPVEELLVTARDELERLHAIVGPVGYAVFVASADGIAIDHRGDPARADDFKQWGLALGGIWSESIEGTNAAGTAIVEERPITVHCLQHFRTRHTSLSCSGAPIFGADGRLAAVLDITSIDPAISERSHALAHAITIDSARAIEGILFRHVFRRCWILGIAPPLSDQVLMLAIDADQRITGANRSARSVLGLDSHLLGTGCSLWRFFQRYPLLKTRDETMALLARNGDSESWRALITPPGTVPPKTGRLRSLLHQKFPSSTETRSTGDGAPSIERKHPTCDEQVIEAEAPLTIREREVLALISHGQSNKEVARTLGIAPETVKTHVKNLYMKLAIARRAQAAAFAQTLGLLQLARPVSRSSNRGQAR